MYKILLMGYMGVGKSTVGRILAEKLGILFVDLDEEIERTAGKTIPEIFKSQGEIVFRRIEAQVLEQILSKKEQAVVALGGGTPAYGSNLSQILAEPNYAVYLKASLATLLSHLKGEQDKRPLLQQMSEEDLPEYIAKHVFERQAYYQQAHRTLTIEGKSPAEIANEIIAGLA